MQYIGRFAPSPTGPLHFGSLVAAVASYCDAKANQGQWLLRIEDLDRPREVVGASDDIINTLQVYGFVWDGDILYQSARSTAYQTALDELKSQGMVYPCTCSRKTITDIAEQKGIEGTIYPQTCLHQAIDLNKTPAWRFKTPDQETRFNDMVLGLQSQQVATKIGDFVIKRADGLFAYQLAVIVDDAAQGVTHVVRGEDLLTSTARQILLQDALGFTHPIYRHTPIVKNTLGQKLSKQTQAEPLPLDSVSTHLCRAFEFLTLNPPAYLVSATSNDCWEWAIQAWPASSSI
jgi:glutamyl-Q tRNA(Asp) synthetase|tara:strand:+ start:2569 stop:3438 length:870 start_codon:yes stop_codon:yes gene_type:complete